MDEELNRKINTFIRTINPKWNKDLRIRYVYRELASYFQRDLEYFLSDYENQLNFYHEGFCMKGKNIVCYSLCVYYKKTYKKIGIDSKIIRATLKEIPHFAMIVHGNHGWYYLDPLLDLMVNQVGMISSYFAHVPAQKSNTIRNGYPYLRNLDFDYVKSLDQQLNVLPYGDYLDTFLDIVHQELLDKNRAKYIFQATLSRIENTMNFASRYLINIGKSLGVFERKLFYERLIFVLFRKKERNGVNILFDEQKRLYFQLSQDVFPELNQNLLFLEERVGEHYSLRKVR